MPRTQQFNRDDVLERAMLLFWSNGYEASSIQDLVEATGINRASLYHSFGSKQALFLAAVDHYVEQINRQSVALLTESDAPARETIESFFERLIAFSLGEGKRLGCLLTNTAIEWGGKSRDVELKLAAVFTVVQGAFESLVRRGQQEGEIARTRDAVALSRFLVATVHGLRVLARSGAKQAVLRDVAKTALAALD